MHSSNQRGANLLEYSVLVALICIAVLGSMRAMGKGTSEKFCKVQNMNWENGRCVDSPFGIPGGGFG